MEKKPYRRAIIKWVRRQARPPDKFSHQPRLYRLATRVGGGRQYDEEVVFAAAWLHDLGVFYGHRPAKPAALAAWDCVAYAMRQAPAVLRQAGFPIAKIPAVLEAIRTHQAAAKPSSLEGLILRDADILEQLGAVGILRMASKVGRDTRYRVLADVLAVLERNLKVLPRQLRLAAARRLAQPRLRLLRDFLAAARTEAEGMPL